MTTLVLRITTLAELLARIARTCRVAWALRAQLAPKARTPLERQFLPAALEIIDTPAPALPRAIIATICVAFLFALLWSIVGHVDMVAVAPGKITAADRTKVIQSAETAVVKRIYVKDGQEVKEGDILIELDAAATATAAETSRLTDALWAARLEAARFDALAHAAKGASATLTLPGAPAKALMNEQRSLVSQTQEHRARLQALDAEIAKRQAEIAAAQALTQKLSQTAPIAKRRAEDYKDLVDKNFISQHGYLEREQTRIEQEQDLKFQQARVKELQAAVEETRKRTESQIAEFERQAVTAKLEADKKTAQLEQELVKAKTRQTQQTLTAPVAGTVQQLAVHTIGGVVTPAQALLVIAPKDYAPEVEAILENKDVGFVKVGQAVEVKVETFPFTRYGTIPGTVSVVSNDAVADEKKGLVFHARVRLEKPTIQVGDRQVGLSPGMAVTAEIATGERRLITYFLDPLRKTTKESLRER
jgi:hemolysin D